MLIGWGDAGTGPGGLRAHGGLDAAELAALGLVPDAVLDFSVNTNPYGPCPEVLAAIRAAPLDRYPDPTAREGRAAIAAALDVSPEAVALGNGAADLLWTLARLLAPAGAAAVVVAPAFSEFAAGVRAAGGRVREWRALPEDGFRMDLGAAGALAAASGARALYLCTPTTPTGATVRAAAVAAWAAAHPEVTVVLDQSFLALGDHAEDAAVPMPENVVRVRSLTKDHAIPAVRVGYLIARPELVARLEAARPAWTTSGLAEAAAIAAVRAGRFVAASRLRLLEDRAGLVTRLARLGLAPSPSAAPFLAFAVRDAAGLRRRLLAGHGILVRDCASFGLEGWVRVAVKPPPALDRLVAALEVEEGRCSLRPS